MNYLLSVTTEKRNWEKRLECSFKVKWLLIKTSLTTEIHADHLQCKMLHFLFFPQLGFFSICFVLTLILGEKKGCLDYSDRRKNSRQVA